MIKNQDLNQIFEDVKEQLILHSNKSGYIALSQVLYVLEAAQDKNVEQEWNASGCEWHTSQDCSEGWSVKQE